MRTSLGATVGCGFRIESKWRFFASKIKNDIDILK